MTQNNNNLILGIGRSNTGTQQPRFGLLLIHTKEFDMTKATVTLWAEDQGANNCLDTVVAAASGLTDFDVVRIPGLSDGVIPDDLRERLYNSNAVVFGISAGHNAGIEARLAAEAMERNPALRGKVLFVEDFPGSSGWRHPDFQRVGKDAHLGSIMPLSAYAPERDVYRDVHTLGLPDHWYPSMEAIQEGARLRADGKLMKRRRGTNELVPLGSDDVVIYLSGMKDPEMEILVLRQLLAIESVRGKPVVVHFRGHPGEKKRPELQAAIGKRDALLEGSWEIASPEVTDAGSFTDSRLIGASNATAIHPGATANFLGAAMRLPMITAREMVRPADWAAATYNYELTGKNVLMVDYLRELPDCIRSLTRKESPEARALCQQQQQNALPFTPGQPTYGKNVLAIINELLKE